MEFVHRPECTQILEAVERGDPIIHVGGGPGIGKSSLIDWLINTLDETYDARVLQLYATHDVESLMKDVHGELYGALPMRQRLTYRLSDISGLWLSSFGIEFDTYTDHIDDLKTVASLIPDDKTVVLCIDDVHKLAEEDRDVREALVRLADVLPPNVQLISAGRILFEDGMGTVLEMQPLSKEGVEELLQATVGIDERTAHRLHERIGGYPYYFVLLSESGQKIGDDGGILDLPEGNFRRHIEENYLQSLEADEERFLRRTVPLVELDERICSLAVSDLTRTEARRLLKTLRHRCIVEDSGYDDQPVRRYRVHDRFREFLCELEQTGRTIGQLLDWLPEAAVEDRQRITEALAEIAADDPTHLKDFIDRVVQPLNDKDRQVRRNASIVVARLAAEYPQKVDSAALSTVIEFLESDDRGLRQAAGQQLTDLSKRNPGVLEPHIDQLRALIERQDDEFPPHIPTIVEQLAREYPEKMRRVVLQLNQSIQQSTQTLLIDDSESLKKLNEQYDHVEFDPIYFLQGDSVSEPETPGIENTPLARSNAESQRTSDPQMPATVYPEDTDITFTGEVKQLHRSQYAAVLKVWYHTNGKTHPAALKQLLTDKEGFTKQFESEINLWSQIDDHENIVTLLDTGTQPRRWFLMTYLGGGSLADRLEQEKKPAYEGFGTSVVECVLDGICDALGYAHKQDIVHGDLTPSNILFGSDSDWIPKVSDWGQAQQLTGVSETTMVYSAAAPTVEGVTLPYAAPEMVDPGTYGEIDRRTDIYQIALIAYELYTGQRPFRASSPAALMRQHLDETPPPLSEVSETLPSTLDAIFETALAKEKSDRYQSVGEFQAVLIN